MKLQASARIAALLIGAIAWLSCQVAAYTTPARYVRETRYRGVNVALEMADAKDLQHLATDWGANLVRVCLYMAGEWGYFVSDRRRPEPFPAEDWERLDEFIDDCESNGLSVVIDLHQWTGYLYMNGLNNRTTLWRNEDYRRELVRFWGLVAQRYADRGDVIYGYDILNEPYSESIGETELASLWQTLATEVTQEIRRHDTRHPVIVECIRGGNPYGFDLLEPIDDDNAIYSFHMWLPSDFTHQGVGGRESGVEYPSEDWTREWLEEQFASVVRFQHEHNAKILVGEIGVHATASAGSRAAYFEDCLTLFESHGFDYCLWSYGEWVGWSVEHGNLPELGPESICYLGTTESLDVWKTHFSLNTRSVVAPERHRILLEAQDWERGWSAVLAGDLMWRAEHCFDSVVRDPPFKLSSLRTSRVAVAGAARGGFDSNEIAALSTYVAEGGGLLIVGSDYSEGLRDLLWEFGIVLDPTPVLSRPSTWDAGSFFLDLEEEHPICEGAMAFLVNWTGSLSATGSGDVFLWTPGQAWKDRDGDQRKDESEPTGPFPIGVASKVGRGRVVYLAEDNLGLTANYQVTYNILSWLGEGPSEDVRPAVQGNQFAEDPGEMAAEEDERALNPMFGSSCLESSQEPSAILVVDGLSSPGAIEDQAWWYQSRYQDGEWSIDGIPVSSRDGAPIVRYEFSEGDGSSGFAIRFSPSLDASEYAGLMIELRADRRMSLEIIVAIEDCSIHTESPDSLEGCEWIAAVSGESIEVGPTSVLLTVPFHCFRIHQEEVARYALDSDRVDFSGVAEFQFHPDTDSGVIEVAQLSLYR